jgi:uncharacterized membrane protein (DUF373 family)
MRQRRAVISSKGGLESMSADGSELPEDVAVDVTRLGKRAGGAFLTIEVLAYVVLGSMLAVAVLLGVAGAGTSLWSAVLGAFQAEGDTEALVLAVDRLLFVLMIVEVMHTVRVSFRSGQLVCEPFLIVGLIASIRRVLVITLESSQAHQPGKWGPDAQAQLNSTMLELSVLAGLILVMVICIALLRLTERKPSRARSG